MKVPILFVLMFCMASMIKAEGIDYSKVLYAGTGSVVEAPIVRYLAWSEDNCIVIQNLVPGGRGTVSAEKKICSLEGKRFSNGYADVDLKRGVFEDGKLFLELGVTPLQPIGEIIMTCEVVFHDGVADHLACKEKLTEENCTCSSGKLDSRTSEVATEGAR